MMAGITDLIEYLTCRLHRDGRHKMTGSVSESWHNRIESEFES